MKINKRHIEVKTRKTTLESAVLQRIFAGDMHPRLNINIVVAKKQPLMERVNSLEHAACHLSHWQLTNPRHNTRGSCDRANMPHLRERQVVVQQQRGTAWRRNAERERPEGGRGARGGRGRGETRSGSRGCREKVARCEGRNWT
jgi:hypothetical protein